jgi:uncharacterized protein
VNDEATGQPAPAPPLAISDNEAEQRYEAATPDGELAAYSEYRRSDQRVVFTHTVTQPEFEGRGVASRLVRHALDDTRDRGLKVTPMCPFVRTYIERHAEYADLLTTSSTDRA